MINKSVQSNFFITTEDAQTIGQFVADSNAVAIAEPSGSAGPLLRKSFASDSDFWPVAYLCPLSLLPYVRTTYIKEQNYYLVDRNSSPVIEFILPVIDGKKLHRCRFYMHTGVDTRDGWLEHPAFLHNFNTQLVKFVRKNILTNEVRVGVPVSKSALLFESRGGEFSQT